MSRYKVRNRSQYSESLKKRGSLSLCIRYMGVLQESLQIVPPREGAVFNEEQEPWQKARNDAISQIIGLGNDEEAIKLWKKLVGYHIRSLVKTAFSRFKGIFGPKLLSRSTDNQEVELNLKAHVLNMMTKAGHAKRSDGIRCFLGLLPQSFLYLKSVRLGR